MFPNPANYYLPMPEQFEAEVAFLPLDSLMLLNFDLGMLLIHNENNEADFESFVMSSEFGSWVQKLKLNDLISLIRWIGERLAYLYHKKQIP